MKYLGNILSLTLTIVSLFALSAEGQDYRKEIDEAVRGVSEAWLYQDDSMLRQNLEVLAQKEILQSLVQPSYASRSWIRRVKGRQGGDLKEVGFQVFMHYLRQKGIDLRPEAMFRKHQQRGS